MAEFRNIRQDIGTRNNPRRKFLRGVFAPAIGSALTVVVLAGLFGGGTDSSEAPADEQPAGITSSVAQESAVAEDSATSAAGDDDAAQSPEDDGSGVRLFAVLPPELAEATEAEAAEAEAAAAEAEAEAADDDAMPPEPPDEQVDSTLVSDSRRLEMDVVTLSDVMEALLRHEFPEAATGAFFGPQTALRVEYGRIGKEQTFSESVAEFDIPGGTANKAVEVLDGVFNFRHCRPGDKWRVTVDGEDKLVDIQYQRSPLEVYQARRTGDDAWEAGRLDIQFETELIGLRGRIDSTLYESIFDIGETPALVMDYASLFAWDIDFSQMTRTGDEYTMLVEKNYLYGNFIGYGKILAASYDGHMATSKMYYYEPENEPEKGNYYTEEGKSARKAFLRAPLRFDRITSGYGNRLHPIHRVRKAHMAIDYGARTGTPIWAVADGRVLAAGRFSRGCGIGIKLKHNNGWETIYCHLNALARQTRSGNHVMQKSVIGYVGATGGATGPHLHYAIKINGRAVNPLKIRFPAGKPIPDDQMERFLAQRNIHDAELEKIGGWESYLTAEAKEKREQAASAAEASQAGETESDGG